MPYAPRHKREKERERAETRRSLGLCANCPSPARPGKTRCQPCADAHTAYRREQRRGA